MADPAFAADHVGQLAGGHAVHVGDLPLADERLKTRIEDESLDAFAAERVRAIEHDELDAGFAALLHAQTHRADERV